MENISTEIEVVRSIAKYPSRSRMLNVIIGIEAGATKVSEGTIQGVRR